jgi:Zn-dependent protease
LSRWESSKADRPRLVFDARRECRSRIRGRGRSVVPCSPRCTEKKETNGRSELGSETKTPNTAFRVAVPGPATSVTLAAVFAGMAAGLHPFGVAPIGVGVGWWLSGINLLLGLFNLLPGAPLDGGRILRAYLWRRHGDPVRASVGAARAGRVLGCILIGPGLLQFVADALVGGVWMAFLGWFLLTAARTEETQVLAGSPWRVCASPTR